MQIHTLLTASQLSNLLQILGALVADYIENPDTPMSKDLRPFMSSPLQWKQLPSLAETIKVAIRGGDKLSSLFELANEIKNSYSQFHNDKEFDTPELNMLKQLRSYLATDSATALSYIQKNAAVFNSPELARIFMPVSMGSDKNALRTVVKNLVGRDGTFLTADEIAMLSETNPKGLTKYKDQRKTHTADYAATLVTYVRSQGKAKVPYPEAYKFVYNAGFTHSMIPGFTGLVDDKGQWYTKSGEALDQVPNLTTYSSVVMNDGKNKDAQWVFKKIKHDGVGYGYGYTLAYKAAQRQAKSEHVKELTLNIGKIQANWQTKIKKFNVEDPLCVAAVVLEILCSFAARIGSAPGRGVGTLLVKNASVTQAGINLAYMGKDSIPTKHIIKHVDLPSKYLLAALNWLLANKGKSDFIFNYKVGTRQLRVTPSMVNKAFHTFGAPTTVTVHKLRTFRGTSLFIKLAEADEGKRPPKTAKEAIDRYKDMTEQVGKLLNHKRGVGSPTEKVTGTTAATSYIDLSAQLDLWERWGFRPPVALEKASKAGDA